MTEQENNHRTPLRPPVSPDGAAVQSPSGSEEVTAAVPSAGASSASGASRGGEKASPVACVPPVWLRALLFASLLLMCNQVRLSDSGILSRLVLSDIGFLVGFVPFCVYILTHGSCRVRLSWLCVLPVMGMCISNGLAGTGLGSLVDTIQMAMQLIGGVLMFSFMLDAMPQLTLLGVSIGVFCNLGVAACQDLTYGAFLTLAPKDVLEVSWGFGGAMTGLFRSKIALSVYLGTSLCLIVPQALSRPLPCGFCRAVRFAFVALFVGAAVFFIPHGLLAVLAGVVMLAAGFGVSRLAGTSVLAGLLLALIAGNCLFSSLHLKTWQATLSPLKGYDYVENADILFGIGEPSESEDVCVKAHELKSAHYDFAAALRLCGEKPLYGVGSGNYQKFIGGAYSLNERRRLGQLPNARLNDIETDSQAGWGILAATLGVPATLLFLLLFLNALGTNIRRTRDDGAAAPGLHLAAASAVAFALCAMFLTDSFTRGIGWFLALAFAAADSGVAGSGCSCAFNAFNRRKLLLLAGIMVVFLGFIPVGARRVCEYRTPKAERQSPPSSEPEPGTPAGEAGRVQPGGEGVAAPIVSEKPAASVAVEQKAAEGAAPEAALAADDSHVLTAEDGDDLYLVFNADKAVQVTLPMRHEPDATGTYAGGILVIPDKAGVPPEGKEPALEYGGAVYEFIIKQETTAYVWCNVLWDGSCGNTLNVKLDEDAVSYTVGNDGTYNAWHWQQSPKSCRLKPGRHKLYVLNREDGVKLSQVLLTNDKESIPEGVEGE